MLNDTRLENYNDLSALQSLKTSKAKEGNADVKAIAKQFESLFVSMMLKSMRDANKGFSEGNMLSSNDTEHYQQMFDSQISVSLSSGRGIGLADVIERQLMAQRGREEASSAGEPLNIASLDGYERKDFTHLSRSKEMKEAIARIEQSLAAHSPDSENEGSESVALDNRPSEAHTPEIPENILSPELAGVDFSSPDKYIETLFPMAKNIEAETGIDARLMLAQSALETGWGQREIYREDGKTSHNLFGIKAHGNWQGDSAQIVTTEFRDGRAVKMKDHFRAYNSYEESFRDYAKFLQNNARYQDAMAQRSDPYAFAEALQKSGYATDPAYANKIQSIVSQHMSALDTADKQADLAGVKGGQ